jgi:N-acetylglutamate synthase-like GNAT family acetyltransferase
LDIRRATREELGEIDALLAASGRPPLPPRVSLANVLVGREADCVIGVVALEVVARRGLTLWAAVAADQDLLAPFGFAPISPGTVPKEVRFMPCYPKQSEAASQILRLELETRL